jgi:hypothetical protein
LTNSEELIELRNLSEELSCFQENIDFIISWDWLINQLNWKNQPHNTTLEIDE